MVRICQQCWVSKWESQMTNSVQWLCKMAGNSHWPFYHTYSMRPEFSMLWMPTELDSDQLVCLGHQNSYLKIGYGNRFPSRVKVPRERLLTAQFQKKQLQRVQFTARARWACNPLPLNPNITIWTSVHLNDQNCKHAIIIPQPSVSWCLTIHSYNCRI